MTTSPQTDTLAAFKARLEEAGGDKTAWLAAAEKLAEERDEYRRLYLSMLELCRKLEKGIIGQKRERFEDGQQLTLAIMGMLTSSGDSAAAQETNPVPPPTPETEVGSHTRRKPTGRKPLPESLPRVDIEILPENVQQQGLDAFVKIGEDVTETVERRPASLVVVRTHRPKFVPKGRDRAEATTVSQASPPELPIERGLAGPGLLADTLVRRWQDHLPLNRLERIYAREGLELSRSTICGWHMTLYETVKALVHAMCKDALDSPYLCTDATGVLVQAKDKCRNSHFWVVVAPGKHVLLRYSKKHNSEAVDKLFPGYKGYVVLIG